MSTDRRPVPNSSVNQQPETQKTSATIEPMTEEERTLLERLLEQAFETINREKKREPPEPGSNLLGTLGAKFLFAFHGTDWIFIGSACALGLTIAHYVGFSRGISYHDTRLQEMTAKLARNVEKCSPDEKRKQMIYLGGFLDLEPQLLSQGALNDFYKKYFTGINLEYFRSACPPETPIHEKFPELDDDVRHLLRNCRKK